MKCTVEFEQIERCMVSLLALEAAREKHHFDEWPGQYIEALRAEMDKLFDSAEIG